MTTFHFPGQQMCLRHVGPAVALAVWLGLAAMSTSAQADPSGPPPGPPQDRDQAWNDDGPRPGPHAWPFGPPARGPEADGPRRGRGPEDRPMPPPRPPRDRDQGWDVNGPRPGA